MQDQKIGRFLSFILHHKPQSIGITLDAHGWARVDELLAGMRATHPITRAELEELVRTDDKMRYSFNDDKTLIRANQGHSIPVDVELRECTPPPVLYHGPGEKYVTSIARKGLLPKTRLYVHLCADVQTARRVGERHGTPVIYLVDAAAMQADGHRFYLSENGVWLTDAVPVAYLKKSE